MVKRRRQIKPFHSNESVGFIKHGRLYSAKGDNEEWEEFQLAIDEAQSLCGQQQRNQETAQESSQGCADADDSDDLTSTAIEPSGHSADVSGGVLAATGTAERNGPTILNPDPNHSSGNLVGIKPSTDFKIRKARKARRPRKRQAIPDTPRSADDSPETESTSDHTMVVRINFESNPDTPRSPDDLLEADSASDHTMAVGINSGSIPDTPLSPDDLLQTESTSDHAMEDAEQAEERTDELNESPESPTPSTASRRSAESTTDTAVEEDSMQSDSDDNGCTQSYEMKSRTDSSILLSRRSSNVSPLGSIHSENGYFETYAMRSQTDSTPVHRSNISMHMEMATAIKGSSSPAHQREETEDNLNTSGSIPDQNHSSQTFQMDVQTNSSSLLDRGSSNGIQMNMQSVFGGSSTSAAHTHEQEEMETEEYPTNQTRLYAPRYISDQDCSSKTYDVTSQTDSRDVQRMSSNVGIERGLQSLASISSAFVPVSRDKSLSYPSTQPQTPQSPECPEAIEYPSDEQINHGLGYPSSTYSKIENDLKLKIPNLQDALTESVKFIQSTGFAGPVLEASIDCETVSSDGVKVAPSTGVQSSQSSGSINRVIIGNPPLNQDNDTRHNNPMPINATDSTTPLQFSEFPELQIFPVRKHQRKRQPSGQAEELAGVPKRKVPTDIAHVEPQNFCFLNQKKIKMDNTGTAQSISQPDPGEKSMLEFLFTEDTHVQQAETKVAVRPTSSPHDTEPHDLRGIDLRTPADSMFLMNGIVERPCTPRPTEHPYRLTARSEDLFRMPLSVPTSGLVNKMQPSLSNLQGLSVEPPQHGQSEFAIAAPPKSSNQHINTNRTIDSMRAMELPGPSRNAMTSQADIFRQQYNPVPRISDPSDSAMNMGTMPYNIPPPPYVRRPNQISGLPLNDSVRGWDQPSTSRNIPTMNDPKSIQAQHNRVCQTPNPYQRNVPDPRQPGWMPNREVYPSPRHHTENQMSLLSSSYTAPALSQRQPGSNMSYGYSINPNVNVAERLKQLAIQARREQIQETGSPPPPLAENDINTAICVAIDNLFNTEARVWNQAIQPNLRSNGRRNYSVNSSPGPSLVQRSLRANPVAALPSSSMEATGSSPGLMRAPEPSTSSSNTGVNVVGTQQYVGNPYQGSGSQQYQSDLDMASMPFMYKYLPPRRDQ